MTMSVRSPGDQPRLRPVSPVKVDGFTVYVANLRGYGKTAEIAANPKVELCYLNADHDQVRITGVAEIVTDTELLAGIWASNPLLCRHKLILETSCAMRRRPLCGCQS